MKVKYIGWNSEPTQFVEIDDEKGTFIQLKTGPVYQVDLGYETYNINDPDDVFNDCERCYKFEITICDY